jgi:hypothetical protein
MRKSLLAGFGIVAGVVAVFGGGRSGDGSVVSVAVLREALASNRAANVLYLRAAGQPPEDRATTLAEAMARKRTLLVVLRGLDAGAHEEARFAAMASLQSDLHLLDAETALARAAAAGATEAQLEHLNAELESLRRTAAVRHARLDDVAVRNGLLPYRTASPF